MARGDHDVYIYILKAGTEYRVRPAVAAVRIPGRRTGYSPKSRLRQPVAAV
jgi:hypothetical protein